MEACELMSSIPIWMGYAANIKARAISLQEENNMIVGLKRLDKEDLKKAHMELHHRLSSWRLGNTGSNLCDSPTICPTGYLLHYWSQTLGSG